jgi:peptidoglycan/LPS O-acetylase OafA/YrhL
LSHCWSLAVEEQFYYLVWPTVLFVSPTSLPWLCGALIAAALPVRTMFLGEHKA